MKEFPPLIVGIFDLKLARILGAIEIPTTRRGLVEAKVNDIVFVSLDQRNPLALSWPIDPDVVAEELKAVRKAALAKKKKTS